MTPPLVSIVTPSFNQARFLEETLLSVLEQDYKPIEYVVVDDGSTDGSVEIVRRYEDRLAWWATQENAGQVTALNRGFAHTSGTYMGFVNSDDTLLPGAVSAMASVLDADPELLLVYGDSFYTDEQSQRRGYLPAREFDVPRMVRNCDNHVVQPSTLWRREAWERYGPLNERGYYFFDFEFFLRFPAERVRRLSQPLSTYRVHPASKSGGAASAQLAREHVRFADEFLAGPHLPAEGQPHARAGRSSARLLGAEFAYDGLELPLARRLVLSGLALYPPHTSSRWLSLAAKTFLPRGVVRRLRARRKRLRAEGGTVRA